LVQTFFKQNGLDHDASVHDSRQYCPPVDVPQKPEVAHGFQHNPLGRHSSANCARFVAQHIDTVPIVEMQGSNSLLVSTLPSG
jgi:hypothetical protein